MADIVPNVVVSMPSQLFTLARSFKAAANGRIYIGKIDTDPTIPENQIQVYVENEDGSHVPMAQPIMINAGGYPVYGGQIAKFVTVEGHSMAVYDAYGAQQFYYPNVLKYDPDQFKQWLLTQLSSPNGSSMIGFDIDVDYPVGTIGHAVSNIFKTEQHIQFYYDKIGNWDDAIFAAQVNVYTKGYSPKLILPSGTITLNRPILGGVALGDKIHSTYPALNFYNSATGQYAATWPLIIHGVFNKQRDATTGMPSGTQIKFSGSASRADVSWRDYGVIHCAPTEVAQIRQTAPVLKFWPGYADLRDFNIWGVNKDASRHPNVHGIVIHNGTQVNIRNVTVYQVYGSGVLFDWSWDSIVENCKFVQCGRMSPTWGAWQAAGNTGYDYQTYAAMHVLRSRSTDNSNFIRFKNNHIEDCYYGAADMIVSGNSSPIWLEDCHFECDAGDGVGAAGKKLAIGLGNFGVTYFTQDSDPSYDYTNRPDTGTGGYLVWRGGGMYTPNYGTGQVGGMLFMTRYSGAILNDVGLPNAGDVWVRGGNAEPYFHASNSFIGNIQVTGGNSNQIPLKLDGVKCGNVTVDFANAVRLSNVTSNGTFNATNFNGTAASNVTVLNGVSFAVMNAQIPNAMGMVYLTSTTTASNIRAGRGNLEIADYAWFRNHVGGN
ncbi:phage head-binding domain-containing protein [Serratia ureilytica]|uniref:phage head-binding domain-containing protein n=1 Tax=Serratia ureilytica TaxID=300181 RepID=UPI002574CDCD|nr:phage head-binding domain-containing protein [Serratia ureilytica]MDM1814960.1 phage head-binding domain-containing protein [Serratia ureilytica]